MEKIISGADNSAISAFSEQKNSSSCLVFDFILSQKKTNN